MCTPIRRWTALQSRHRNTPKVADAHDGFRAGQSKQTLFSVFARIFFRMRFFSAVGRQTLSILGSTLEKPGRLDPQRMQPSCSDDILLALLLESLLISYFTWQVKYFVSLLCIKSIIVPIYQCEGLRFWGRWGIPSWWVRDTRTHGHTYNVTYSLSTVNPTVDSFVLWDSSSTLQLWTTSSHDVW